MMQHASFDARMRQSRWTGLGLGALLALSLLLNLGQFIWRGEPVTVLLPATPSGGYEIRASRFDARHLADSAVEVVHLFFNVTPETLTHRRAVLMAWAHPSARQTIADQIKTEAATITQKSLSLAFAVKATELVRLETHQAVVEVRGILTRWVADRRVDSDVTLVTVRFARDAQGTPLVSGIAWKRDSMDEGTP